jgi:site-specific DNA-methyltransferase (adenine-specific)
MSEILYCGDCLDIMPTLEAGSVDMVLADPPYGTTACKWDSVIPFEPMWAGIKHATKKAAAVVMTASQQFTSALVMSNAKMFRHGWVWIKNKGGHPGCARFMPMREHEDVCVFSFNTPIMYAPQMQPRNGSGEAMVRAGIKTGKVGGDKAKSVYRMSNEGYDNACRDPLLRLPSSVQRFNVQRGHHPTQKPVALMEYLIRTYTNEGDIVLDFTMGSGTTGIACVNTGRNFIGIEKDPTYFAIAQERIARARQ